MSTDRPARASSEPGGNVIEAPPMLLASLASSTSVSVELAETLAVTAPSTSLVGVRT